MRSVLFPYMVVVVSTMIHGVSRSRFSTVSLLGRQSCLSGFHLYVSDLCQPRIVVPVFGEVPDELIHDDIRMSTSWLKSARLPFCTSSEFPRCHVDGWALTAKEQSQQAWYKVLLMHLEFRARTNTLAVDIFDKFLSPTHPT